MEKFILEYVSSGSKLRELVERMQVTAYLQIIIFKKLEQRV